MAHRGGGLGVCLAWLMHGEALPKVLGSETAGAGCKDRARDLIRRIARAQREWHGFCICNFPAKATDKIRAKDSLGSKQDWHEKSFIEIVG